MSLVLPYKRRSQRLQNVHAKVGLALGGLPSARLLRHRGMQVSGDTILHTPSRSMAGFEASRPDESPREIGIDDWAYRPGHYYGTVVFDLELKSTLSC